jgi:hypothetical protein
MRDTENDLIHSFRQREPLSLSNYITNSRGIA